MLIVPRYSEERKASVLAKLSPPHRMTVAALARQEGISDQIFFCPLIVLYGYLEAQVFKCKEGRLPRL